MMLRSIAVSRWGVFVEPMIVDGFTEGINLLEAPNETGKSTLLEALRMAIFDRHTLAGKEMQEIVPWGKKLSPRLKSNSHQRVTNTRSSNNLLTGPFRNCI